MGKAITSDKFQLGTASSPVRLSYVHLDKPTKVEGSEGAAKFQVTALLDPNDATHAQQIAHVQGLMGKLLIEGGVTREELKSYCIGRGDTRKKKGSNEVLDGYAGMVFIGPLKNEDRIPVVGRNMQPVIKGDKQFPYSGSFGILKGTIWLQDNKWGKRINGNILTLQFVKDGTPFGREAVDPNEEFTPLDGNAPAPAGGGVQKADSFLF